ncbi:glucuronate isomerase [Paenibacillus terrigena]|uniref:glucuronate isomerase n=1 Tax=Paenibacillus terrigena TaxID=369333 RepID=UPI0028D5D7C3|nr:glucuronate isomerase [Paenibacillus terrigena]
MERHAASDANPANVNLLRQPDAPIESLAELEQTVRHIVLETPVYDIHTHLYSADFEERLLWGVDQLLVYHYLTAEYFRQGELSYDEFWAMDDAGRADRVWQALFVDSMPVSEAASGVVTALNRLGLSPSVYGRDLDAYRAAWAGKTAAAQVNDVLATAKVKTVVMTNDPFDAVERAVWLKGGCTDARFQTALRIDKLLLDWTSAATELRSLGYAVAADDPSALSQEATLAEVRRFLRDWCGRIGALYIMASLPGDVQYPAPGEALTMLLDGAVVPVCRELGLPLALMVGVRRQVNPALYLAGDMSMQADLGLLERLCLRYPELQLLVTVLARENQHQLAVLARKFSNLTIFGCWWFLHTESMIREMTAFRTELLGTSYIPQHSDCRVLEQLVNKWDHSRSVIAGVLYDKYARLHQDRWLVSENDIRCDIEHYFGGVFQQVLSRAKMGRG